MKNIEINLDKLLKILYNKGLFVGIDEYTLSVKVSRERDFPDLKLSDKEFVLVKDVLLQEEMIERKQPTTNSNYHYYVTVKGVRKFVNGGYNKDVEEKNFKRMSDRMIFLAQIFIIIAGIYYLLEIFKMFCGC